MGLFRAIIIVLFCGIFFYVSHQLLRFTGVGLPVVLGVLAFLVFIFGLVLAMPLYLMVESKKEHKPWHDSLLTASHFALAYVNFLGTLVILRDVFAFLTNYIFSPKFEWMQADALYGPDALGLMLVLPFLMILAGTIIVRVGPRLTKIEVKSARLPRAFDGLRILHITDLHIGTSLPLTFVQKLVKLTQDVKADLVVYTGDIIDGHIVRHLNELELLRSVPAPLGNFYVTGNHEYYWQGDQALAAFRSIKFNVLVNEVFNIERAGEFLQIVGTPDPAAKGFGLEGPDFDKVKNDFIGSSFKVLLAHQPFQAPQADAIGIDLQLSGHTHGGQFFPWNFLIGFFQKYPKGLYKVGNLSLYVNQGTGYWGPSLRMGTYCEVTEITLRAGG
jgi:predicted MPP superfamily phosphohydrolase